MLSPTGRTMACSEPARAHASRVCRSPAWFRSAAAKRSATQKEEIAIKGRESGSREFRDLLFVRGAKDE